MQNTDTADLFPGLQDLPILSETAPEPSPNNPPWNSWIALGVWFTSVLLILILPSLFLIPYLLSSGVQLSAGEKLKEFATSDPTAVILQLISIIPAHVLTIALCWLIVTRGMRYSFFRTLGVEMGGYRWWHFVLILVGVFAAIVAVGSIFPEQDNDMLRMLRSSRSAVYLVTILATFTAPIAEELVYRGVLFSAFQRSRGTTVAVIAVTFMFAGVHYLQYWGSPGTIILITLLSLVLTLVRSTSRNLLPCVILHFLFNGFQSMVILQQSFETIPLSEQAPALLRSIIQ